MLHEVRDVINELVTPTCVTLDPELVHTGVGFQIRIKCDLDDVSRRCIETIVAKHQLALREEKGYVLILKLH